MCKLICRCEVRVAFERLGHPLSGHEIATVCKKVDTNRDGKYNFQGATIASFRSRHLRPLKANEMTCSEFCAIVAQRQQDTLKLKR